MTRRRVGRLLTFRRVSRPAPGVGFALLLTLLAAWFAAVTLRDAVEATVIEGFSEWGIASGLALWMAAILTLLLIAGWNSPPRLARVLADLAWLGILFEALMAVVGLPLAILSPSLAEYQSFIRPLAAWSLSAWFLVAVWRLGENLWRERPSFAGLRVLAVVLVPLLVVPAQSVVFGPTTPRTNADIWSLSRQAYTWAAPANTAASAEEPGGGEPSVDIEDVFARQGDLLAATLGAVRPTAGNEPQLYFLGAAPDAAQDVFAREVNSVKALFDSRFGTRGHSAILINSYETLDTVPLASASNLKTALKAFGGVMDRDRDVLMLFITTHGAKGILSVTCPAFP